MHEYKVPDVYKNTIIESRNASFFEHVFPCNSGEESRELQQFHETTIKGSQNEGNCEAQEEEVQKEEQEVEVRCSKKVRIEKSFGLDFLTFLLKSEPQSFKEAVTSLESALWKEAISNEVESILQKYT